MVTATRSALALGFSVFATASVIRTAAARSRSTAASPVATATRSLTRSRARTRTRTRARTRARARATASVARPRMRALSSVAPLALLSLAPTTAAAACSFPTTFLSIALSVLNLRVLPLHGVWNIVGVARRLHGLLHVMRCAVRCFSAVAVGNGILLRVSSIHGLLLAILRFRFERLSLLLRLLWRAGFTSTHVDLLLVRRRRTRGVSFIAHA